MNLADAPEVMTVPEAARVCRVSRGSAYALARRFIDSNGVEGLPCIQLGRSLRVSRHQLATFLGAELRGAPAMTTDAPQPQPVPARQADTLRDDPRGSP
jgi:hypothetical protein